MYHQNDLQFLLSKFQYDYAKGHSAQHCLFMIIEKGRKFLDGRVFVSNY